MNTYDKIFKIDVKGLEKEIKSRVFNSLNIYPSVNISEISNVIKIVIIIHRLNLEAIITVNKSGSLNSYLTIKNILINEIILDIPKLVNKLYRIEIIKSL